MTEKRQKATKVKCKRDESRTKQSIYVEYSLLSLEQAFEFYWLFVDEHNTLPKSTRRKLKLNKFTFWTPWLPDLLSKRWFASSVWNFCHGVADVPPHETSPAAKSEEKLMLSQARPWGPVWKFCSCPLQSNPVYYGRWGGPIESVWLSTGCQY